MTSDRPKFVRGQAVILYGRPEEIGQVVSEPARDTGTWWYEVKFGIRREEYSEAELDECPDRESAAEDLAMDGIWGRHEALLRGMAVERVLRQYRSTVYSFNANRIKFLPHQYRPLLRLLDSEDRRLLIADEVGLGKTIEAGLILTELRARQKLERVLVLCPSRLRQKWQAEMSRKFRLEFEIWDGARVNQLVQKVQSSGRLPRFYAIASIQMMRSVEQLEKVLGVLPEIDLLISDEAHHARNPGTATAKMVAELSALADGFMMLSATPLHLGSQDLFHLLRLLRPSEFSDLNAFQTSLWAILGIDN